MAINIVLWPQSHMLIDDSPFCEGFYTEILHPCLSFFLGTVTVLHIKGPQCVSLTFLCSFQILVKMFASYFLLQDTWEAAASEFC
jgi:hypothetical protein